MATYSESTQRLQWTFEPSELSASWMHALQRFSRHSRSSACLPARQDGIASRATTALLCVFVRARPVVVRGRRVVVVAAPPGRRRSRPH